MKKLRGILFLVALVCLVLALIGWHESKAASGYTTRQASDALVKYVDARWSAKGMAIQVHSARCSVTKGGKVVSDARGSSFVCSLGVTDGECIGAEFTYDGTTIEVTAASALPKRFCA